MAQAAKKSAAKKHWHCEGFVRTGCGGRGAKVVDLKRGKEELEQKHTKMQKDLDAEIEGAKAREAAESKAVAEAAQAAATKAAKEAQVKIDKKREQATKAKREPGKAHPGSKKPNQKRVEEIVKKVTKGKSK